MAHDGAAVPGSLSRWRPASGARTKCRGQPGGLRGSESRPDRSGFSPARCRSAADRRRRGSDRGSSRARGDRRRGLADRVRADRAGRACRHRHGGRGQARAAVAGGAAGTARAPCAARRRGPVLVAVAAAAVLAERAAAHPLADAAGPVRDAQAEPVTVAQRDDLADADLLALPEPEPQPQPDADADADAERDAYSVADLPVANSITVRHLPGHDRLVMGAESGACPYQASWV